MTINMAAMTSHEKQERHSVGVKLKSITIRALSDFGGEGVGKRWWPFPKNLRDARIRELWYRNTNAKCVKNKHIHNSRIKWNCFNYKNGAFEACVLNDFCQVSIKYNPKLIKKTKKRNQLETLFTSFESYANSDILSCMWRCSHNERCTRKIT